MSERALVFLCSFGVLVLLSFASCDHVRRAAQDDRVTWCYVESSAFGTFYRLRGHRTWRPDIDLGSYLTVPAMMDVATRIGCVWPVSRPTDAGLNQP